MKAIALKFFTQNAAEMLSGPAWLNEMRRAMVDQLADVVRPDPDEEVWRYSRVGELDLDQIAPATERPTPMVPPGGQRFTNPSAVAVLQNGWITSLTLSDEAAAAGLTVGPVADLPDGQERYGAALSDPADLFGYLNRAFGPEPLAIIVPDGVALAEPIVVTSLTDSASAVFPRIIVHCGANAAATVVEMQTSSAEATVVAPVLEVTVGQGARYQHCVVQNMAADTWQFGHQAINVGQDATAELFMAGLGGDYVRTRTDCRLVGRGAYGRLTAAYFGEDSQTMDFRTFQDHAAPDTTSELLFKGALDGASRSIYTGLIKVRPEGTGTKAYQTNRNIKLSPEAWAESVPNLEIETNDVMCSHASAVSPVDEEQRFYLESRGVPTPVAERLLLEGFFAEVAEVAPVPAVAEILQEAIVAKLDRRTENLAAAQEAS